jgi:tripartite-type tricarboxylate transporter receptor subunit TctC
MTRDFRHRMMILGLAIFAGLALEVGAQAQSRQPIRIVVPFVAGGGTDIVSRLFSEQIGRTNGWTITIENRPGGGTAIGTEAASRAAPDGNTLLVAPPAFLINPLIRKLNYEPLASFEPTAGWWSRLYSLSSTAHRPIVRSPS